MYIETWEAETWTYMPVFCGGWQNPQGSGWGTNGH